MDLQAAHFPPVTLDAAALMATHRAMDASPPGREDLAFTLKLPQGWACDPTSLVSPGDGSKWTPLAVFGNRESNQVAMVAVLWRKLEVEVPLDQWIAFQTARLNVDIISFRTWNDARGMVIDVGGTFVGHITAPGQPVGKSDAGPQLSAAVRAMARCDAQDVFTVWGICARDSYPDVAQDLAIAAASFELKRAPSRQTMEAMQCVGAAAPAFEVFCPASWTHQPIPDNLPLPGKSGLNLILAPSGALDGFVRVKAIDVRVVSDLTMDRLVQDATEELAEGNITLSANWLPASDPAIVSTPDLEAALIAGGLVQQAPYEIHFGVVQRPPLIFCVTAIVAAPNTDAIACMRGRRAYTIALATSRPQ